MRGPAVHERRHSARHKLRARAWCEAQGLTLYGRVGNVSATGMFLLTAAPLEPGTRVQVQLPLSDDEQTLVAEAEVVWSRDAARAEQLDSAADRGASGLAVRFVDLSPAAQDALRALLSDEARAW